MSIKSKLILATAALLCLATAVMGMVATGAVLNTMTDRLDRQLRDYVQQAADSPRGEVELDESEPLASREIAVLTAAHDGTVVDSRPAGIEGNPLPLPQLPSPLPDPGKIETVPATDGVTAYRVLVSDDPELLNAFPVLDTGESSLVAAIPLTEVHETRDDLLWAMGITVALVLSLGATAAWWITRRGMRPVNQMIDAAAAVADGELTRRLPARDQRTEIGRLGTALNIMVSKLVDAITQRDAQQARLRHFVADASHELRTPLAAIGGYAELYESGGVPAGPAMDRAMTRIRTESHRMEALVEDLLLLAKLDQQSVREQRDIDLRQLVHDAMDDARAADGDRPLEMTAPGPVVVAADEGHMRQVITNLLANARTHTPPGTRVSIGLHRQRDHVVLSVTDDGPGIPPQHRHRVFDRFYRADASRSRETGGTGLGLSIVKSIVESHGGRVEIDSRMGIGTTVRAVFPAVDD